VKKKEIVFSLGFAGFLAAVSFIASARPDGLEKVAQEYGFIKLEKSILNSPMPDYSIPLVKNEKLSSSVAGISGVLSVFIFSLVLGSGIRKRKG